MEYRLKRKDGGFCRLEDNFVVLPDKAGQPLFLQGVVRDVTERYRLEEERRQMEQTLARTEKLEAIGTLAAGIAHDFNNMLAGMFGFIELSMETAKIANQRRIVEYLSHALSDFNRAKDLTGQLLTFTKGGAPRKKSQVLSDFVKKTVLFSLSGSNISPAYAFDPDFWMCDFDEVQMSRALGNMIINAREAMPDGGNIEVHIANIAPESVPEPYPKQTYVKISIRDHGNGIPSEHLPKIFEPFFSTKKLGSGIGLATSYSIVRQHGGFITVDSRIGEGSTFSIYLPASSEVTSSEKQSSDLSSGPKAGRILIMDDEEIILKMLSIKLDKMGFDVEMAGDGDQAIALARGAVQKGRPFQCAILDLTVPGGRGGKESVKELSALDSNMKIVVSSGYSNDPVMADPTAYGFFEKLEKPFRNEDLVKIIESIFGNRGKEKQP